MNMTGTSNVRSISFTASRPRAPVGKLNIGQDNSRPLGLGKRHSLGMGTRDTKDTMAETFDEPFQIESNEGLVFDDQYIGGNLCRKLAAGFFDQIAQRGRINIENLCRIILRKALQVRRAKMPGAASAEFAQDGARPAGSLPAAAGFPLIPIEFHIFVNSR